MKKRILFLLALFCSLTILFVLQKPLFISCNASEALNLKDYLDVMYHGISLDATMAGYLCIIPLLLTLVSVWLHSFALRKWLLPYYWLIALFLAIIFVADCALYAFWGFKLDATIFNYLDSPGEAFASVSVGYILIRLILVLLCAFVWAYILRCVTPRQLISCKRRVATSALLLLMGGGLFIVIRGGVSESTANIGQVYYSSNQFLNHAAVNPCFSLLSSWGKNERFEDMYDFFSEEERASLFDGLYPASRDNGGQTTSLLKTHRPNILLIMLEGFGCSFVESLGGVEGVAPNLDTLRHEGVWFTNLYANSYRTDRGTISILSGYPGLPKTSVMKIPAKSRTLPSIAGKLAEAGYQTDFLYGGDINFTNMKSYLLGSGYQRITADTDFTIRERNSNAWGVNDDITFEHLYNTLCQRTDTTARWFTTFLTLSSHEPFQVPFNRFPDDPILNSFAYTDSCLGNFINRLKKEKLWDNLLIICLPDHGVTYRPAGLNNHTDPRVFHIPMLWLGGAVKKPCTIQTLASQTDLPATLLNQLNIEHADFLFSRDVLSSNYLYPFAFYTFNNGLGFRDSTGISVYDNDAQKAIFEHPESPNGEISLRMKRGQAILQSVFDDLGGR